MFRFIALLAAIVLSILAAFLGWNFGPHHCFALISLAITCIAFAMIEKTARTVIP